MYDARRYNYDYSPNSPARYVYGIQCGPFIKVGVAANVAARLRQMQLANPYPLTVVLKRKMKAAFYCERKMHEILAAKAVGREWFCVTPDEVSAAVIVGAIYAKEIHTSNIDTGLTQAGASNLGKRYKSGIS